MACLLGQSSWGCGQPKLHFTGFSVLQSVSGNEWLNRQPLMMASVGRISFLQSRRCLGLRSAHILNANAYSQWHSQSSHFQTTSSQLKATIQSAQVSNCLSSLRPSTPMWLRAMVNSSPASKLLNSFIQSSYSQLLPNSSPNIVAFWDFTCTPGRMWDPTRSLAPTSRTYTWRLQYSNMWGPIQFSTNFLPILKC